MHIHTQAPALPSHMGLSMAPEQDDLHLYEVLRISSQLVKPSKSYNFNVASRITFYRTPE